MKGKWSEFLAGWKEYTDLMQIKYEGRNYRNYQLIEIDDGKEKSNIILRFSTGNMAVKLRKITTIKSQIGVKLDGIMKMVLEMMHLRCL